VSGAAGSWRNLSLLDHRPPSPNHDPDKPSQSNVSTVDQTIWGVVVSAPVYLVASSDDYLLEEALGETVREVCAEFGDIEPETMPESLTPEDLAVELCSPSLFAPQRVLVVPEIRAWIDIPAKRSPDLRPAEKAVVDAAPVLQVLGEGIAEGIALVMGACCHGKPKGALVDAVDAAGGFRWQPVPDPPKPWEDAVLSREQEAMLRKLLSKVAGDVRFTPEATRLLLERLGFAPRLLVQEGRKLAAANVNGMVDEELVLALSFPQERSLDVVWDAVFERQATPVLDIMAATEAGIQVRDRQGRPVTSKGVPQIIFSQVASILQNLLYLRRLAAEHGFVGEMSTDKTRDDFWYPRRFKNGLGPKIVELVKADAPSPIQRTGGRAPTLFALGRLFKGAGRYTDGDLVQALAGAGVVETALRGDMAAEALSLWIASTLN
jgi:hypothetical protein